MAELVVLEKKSSGVAEGGDSSAIEIVLGEGIGSPDWLIKVIG